MDAISASTSEPGKGKQTAAARPARVLACVSCSQRKIKCDRVFPCENCERAGTKCVPAVQLGRRRRRFPERELLERIRYYERLLRQNHLKFQPLHPEESERQPEFVHTSPDPEDEAQALDLQGDSHSDVSSSNNKAVDFHRAIGRLSLNSEDDEDDDNKGASYVHVSDGSFKIPWAQRYDHLLFFDSPTTTPNLSTLHPNQNQIFRLWQVYLENINPLLKVMHTPTLQARLIDAISDLTSVQPAFQALLFSIYCVSVMSLSENECCVLFGRPREALLSEYYFACQQALRNSSVLSSDDTDCLTALYLYLVSVRAKTDPRSLSSILAVAIRIAKRKKLHEESSYASYDVLEAELCRRLWWSLTLFDHRICEMSDFRETSLAPTWDCRPPRNVNDLDLRPKMKSLPTTHDMPTEALFAVVRSELADFVRKSAFHINFINPSLNTIAKPKATRQSQVHAEGDELAPIDTAIENGRLSTCDPENPLHYMTIWTTRSNLARNRLLQYFSRQSMSPVPPSAEQRDAAITCALRMIECDTNLRADTRIKGFLWFVDMHLPAIAFNHILQGLRKRPDEKWADEAWATMSANYEARVVSPSTDSHRAMVIWIPIVLQVWSLREALLLQQQQSITPPEVPLIVTRMREKAGQMSPQGGKEMVGAASREMYGLDESRLHMPMDLDGFMGMDLDGCPDTGVQPLMTAGVDQFWPTDWSQIQTSDG